MSQKRWFAHMWTALQLVSLHALTPQSPFRPNNIEVEQATSRSR